MWDLPGPGLEPMSLALAGGFLTTVPPGKPLYQIFKEELTPNSSQTLPKKEIEEEETLLNSFCDTSIILISKPDITHKKKTKDQYVL